MSEWEGGERQGIRWRRVGAAVLVLAIVGGTYYVARNRDRLAIDTGEGPAAEVSETVEVVVTAPLRAGDRWYCPTTYPVAVFDDGEYRPPEYPDPGGNDRPVHCYADVERAQADGYDLASPPSGVVVAGGVYLEPTRSPSTQTCAELADDLQLVVACPTRLPVPAHGPSCEIDSCHYGDSPGAVIEQRLFLVPPDWPEEVQPQVIVASARVSNAGADEKDEGLVIDGPTELVACTAEEPVVATSQPRFVQCPEGQQWIPRFQGEPHEGHTAAFWRKDDAVYGASVEGHHPRAAELLHALIDGLDYVTPAEAR